ncbi:MAG: ABC-type uncharacterized transport system [halophilic archaeon J07HB67]|jgi:ABC-type uncharacterized transport system.|nr:MAG: ABC-type uncharacterized transport system [halophilic archaeon J07HB67]
MRELIKAAGLAVGIVTLVVGMTAAIPLVQSQPTTTPEQPAELENTQYDPENVLIDSGPETGQIEMSADVESKTVVFDVSHSNDLERGEISPLVDALVANGHTVRFFDSRADRTLELNSSLSKADAFVTVNPRSRFTSSQRRGLENFTNNGGRMVVMMDPSSSGLGGLLGTLASRGSASTPSGSATSVTSEYSISTGTSELFNISADNRHYPRIAVTGVGGGLGEGVDRVVMDEAVPVAASGRATVTVRTTNEVTIESNRRSGRYPVAATTGNVSVIGDATFLQPDDAYVADNEVLIGNVADFLVAGEKIDENAPVPDSSGEGGTNSPPGPRR